MTDGSLIFMTMCHGSSFHIPSVVTHVQRLLQPNKGISHQVEALQLYPSMSHHWFLTSHKREKIIAILPSFDYVVFLSVCV